MFDALRAFLASQPRTKEWRSFDIIMTALFLIDSAVVAAGGYNEDVARTQKAVNAWMFEELRKLDA